jgi:hypothetical protein
MYGGIVHFISKNNDLGGVDLPQSGKFFSFKLFSKEVEESFPTELLETEPDRRNIIYWNPNAKMNAMGLFSFTVDPMKAKGDFEIIIQGIDNNGKPFCAKHPIAIE